MPSLRVITIPLAFWDLRETVVRQPGLPIDLQEFNPELLAGIVHDMFELLYKRSAVGLAAPQVGFSLQLAVIDIKRGREGEPLVLINPKITYRSEELETGFEDCLSMPGYGFHEIKRAKQIQVVTSNLQGRSVTITAEGLLARVIQHEVDHLKGTLVCDHLKNTNGLSFLDPETLSMRATENQ